MPLGTQQKKQPACSWPEPLALRLVPRNPRGAPGDRLLAGAGSGLLGGTRGRPSGEIWRENGLGFGASIGLSAVKTASKCISYI